MYIYKVEVGYTSHCIQDFLLQLVLQHLLKIIIATYLIISLEKLSKQNLL